MSTEIFRKYIDLLNESVSDEQLREIEKALSELERVLSKEKYHPTGIRSYFNEDEPPDPPLFGPDSAPSPSGPKPRIPRLPGETADEYLERVRELARSAQRLGIRSGTSTSTPTEPVDINPFSRDPMGRPVEPVTARASTGGTVTTTPTGVVHTAPKPKGIRIPKPAAYATLGAAALAGAYGLLNHFLKIRFKDLDPSDQDSINKNLSILEPYIKPEMLSTLPGNIQLRISTVLKQLDKLEKSSSSPVAAAEKPVEKPAFDPANPWKKPSDTWTPDGTPTEEEIAKFMKDLQAARQNVSGVRESLDMSQLSEAEKMAILRDKVTEDGFIPDSINPFSDENALQKLLAALGISSSVPVSVGTLHALWNKWLADEPMYADEKLLTKIPAFKNWILRTYPTWIKAGKGAVVAGVTWTMIKAAGLIWDYLKLGAAAEATQQAIQDLPKQGNNETELYNKYLHMPKSLWNNLNSDQKNDIDEFLLSYCLRYTDAPHCGQTKDAVCRAHPDWVGCQDWLKRSKGTQPAATTP